MTFAQYAAKPDIDLNTSIIITTGHGLVRTVYTPLNKKFTDVHVVDFDEPYEDNPVFEVDSYAQLEEALCNLISAETVYHDVKFFG